MNVLNGAPFVQNRDATSDVGFTAGACASTYAIVVGIWALLFLVVLYSALRHANGAWPLVSMLGCVLVFVLCWVWSFRIRIFGNSVSYRSLLAGTRTLQLDEIEKAEVKIATTEKFGPVYSLILWPESFAEKKSIVINMKVFSKADLNRVFDFLGPKLRTDRRFSLTGTEREELIRKIPG
jgi:hypothetical protein